MMVRVPLIGPVPVLENTGHRKAMSLYTASIFSPSSRGTSSAPSWWDTDTLGTDPGTLSSEELELSREWLGEEGEVELESLRCPVTTLLSAMAILQVTCNLK